MEPIDINYEDKPSPEATPEPTPVAPSEVVPTPTERVGNTAAPSLEPLVVPPKEEQTIEWFKKLPREHKVSVLKNRRIERFKSLPREQKIAVLQRLREEKAATRPSYERKLDPLHNITDLPAAISAGGLTVQDKEPHVGVTERAAAKALFHEPKEQALYLTNLLKDRYPDHNIMVLPDRTGREETSSFVVWDMDLKEQVGVIDPRLTDPEGWKDIPSDIVDFVPLVGEVAAMGGLTSMGFKPLLKMGVKRGMALGLANAGSAAATSTAREILASNSLDEHEFSEANIIVASALNAGAPVVAKGLGTAFKGMATQMSGKSAKLWMYVMGKGSLGNKVQAKNLLQKTKLLDRLTRKYKELGMTDLDDLPDAKAHLKMVQKVIGKPISDFETKIAGLRVQQIEAYNSKVGQLKAIVSQAQKQGLEGRAATAAKELDALLMTGPDQFYDDVLFPRGTIPTYQIGDDMVMSIGQSLENVSTYAKSNSNLKGAAEELNSILAPLTSGREIPQDEVLGIYRQLGDYMGRLNIGKQYQAYEAAYLLKKRVGRLVPENVRASMQDYADFKRLLPDELFNLDWDEPLASDSGAGLITSTGGMQINTGAGIGAVVTFGLMGSGVPAPIALVPGAAVGAGALIGSKALHQYATKPNAAFKLLRLAERSNQPLTQQFVAIWNQAGLDAAVNYASTLPKTAGDQLARSLAPLIATSARTDPEFVNDLAKMVRENRMVSGKEKASLLRDLNKGQLPAEVEQALDQMSTVEYYEHLAARSQQQQPTPAPLPAPTGPN